MRFRCKANWRLRSPMHCAQISLPRKRPISPLGQRKIWTPISFICAPARVETRFGAGAGIAKQRSTFINKHSISIQILLWLAPDSRLPLVFLLKERTFRAKRKRKRRRRRPCIVVQTWARRGGHERTVISGGIRTTIAPWLELSRAAELMPSSSEVPLTAAFIYIRQNKFRERIAALERAVTLDPRDTHAWNRTLRDFSLRAQLARSFAVRDHVWTLCPQMTQEKD